MDKVASEAVDLTGDWVLDRRVSDDVRALLMPIIEKTERRWRLIERRFDEEQSDPRQASGPSPNDTARSPTEPSQMQWMRQMRRREADALIAFV